MVINADLSKVRPASYNPRKLSPTAFEDLKASITLLGIIKPIVVRGEDMLILAGHQRTKTMLALGIKEAPAFVVTGVNSSDEIRFNQLHNITEAEVTERAPVVYVKLENAVTGFVEVKNKDISIVKPGEEGPKVMQLTKLIQKFGQFASCVCDKHGRVLISSIYGMAAKLNGLDLLVYVLPEGLEQTAIDYFSKSYGEFSYESIDRKTYMQSFAQKDRLRTSKKKPGQMSHSQSTLYSKVVIPQITKEMRVLDFGAGKQDYRKKLMAAGYHVDAIEFFLRKEGNNELNTKQIREDCRNICENIKKHGLYDVVVCDSVLNSVDTLEAERSVLMSLAALCKPGGTVYWSGIPVDFIKKSMSLKTCKAPKTGGIKFLDKDNFTANFRSGDWFFQKYHSLADIKRLTKEHIGELQVVYDFGKPTTKEVNLSSFQVKAKNTHPHTMDEYREALRFEFTLPLPGGKRWDLDQMILPVWEKAFSEALSLKP